MCGSKLRLTLRSTAHVPRCAHMYSCTHMYATLCCVHNTTYAYDSSTTMWAQVTQLAHIHIDSYIIQFSLYAVSTGPSIHIYIYMPVYLLISNPHQYGFHSLSGHLSSSHQSSSAQFYQPEIAHPLAKFTISCTFPNYVSITPVAFAFYNAHILSTCAITCAPGPR